MDRAKRISFVIPLLNEEESLTKLHGAISRSVEPLTYEYEIIFVDDGSSDRSPEILKDLHEQDGQHVRVIQFRRNFGKMAAMTAGFARARGDIIVTMDADLQDDPAELIITDLFMHRKRLVPIFCQYGIVPGPLQQAPEHLPHYGMIFRHNLDASGTTDTLYTGLNSPKGITLDYTFNRVLWGEDNQIASGPINGGGPEMQFSNFNGDIYIRKQK